MRCCFIAVILGCVVIAGPPAFAEGRSIQTFVQSQTIYNPTPNGSGFGASDALVGI